MLSGLSLSIVLIVDIKPRIKPIVPKSYPHSSFYLLALIGTAPFSSKTISSLMISPVC
jgi:hypothetical protein